MSKATLLTVFIASLVSANRPRGLQLDGRVVGGTPATIEQYPFVVAMLRDAWETGVFSQNCGGTILTSQHILSAASCYQPDFYSIYDYSQPHVWQVRAGSTFRSSGGSIFAVAKIINNPNFDDNTINNDVSVVMLSNPMPLGPSIGQASVPPQGYSHPDDVASYVLGWGRTTQEGSVSEHLLVGRVFTINQEICVRRYATLGWYVSDAMLCAGLPDVGGVDACHGDTGGPLVLDNIVIGVTSWGRGCGLAIYPSVYATVSHFTDWILSTVNSFSIHLI